jgi:Peptidase inhibitor family I36
MKRRVSRAAVLLGAATLFAGGVVAVAAAPASAAVTCPSTEVCVYSDIDYRGTVMHVPYSVSDYTAWSPVTCKNPSFSDCASSVINAGTSCTVYLWTDINYKGYYHSLAKGDRVPDVTSKTTGFHDPNFNDKVSSHHWCTPKP